MRPAPLAFVPKPLAASTRLVLTCAGCGRFISRNERFNLYFQPACPDCGSKAHKWERITAGWVARLIGQWRLWRWKRAQKGVQ
jgi:predicted RNA-binding Zn-ribbon protein involved in translation (DUF1610 family)